jgi:cysteinyl-tRNA synthetase
MDIRSINNRSFVDQTSRTRKPESTSGVDRPEATKQLKSVEGSNDSFTIGEANKSDLAYATDLLQNVKRNAYQNLREVKQKIENGAYDTPAVQKSLSTEIGKDLGFLESLEVSAKMQSQDAAKEVSDTQMTDSLKEKLTSSDEVLNKVSERILNELFRL